jgi:hypothetical protein
LLAFLSAIGKLSIAQMVSNTVDNDDDADEHDFQIPSLDRASSTQITKQSES